MTNPASCFSTSIQTFYSNSKSSAIGGYAVRLLIVLVSPVSPLLACCLRVLILIWKWHYGSMPKSNYPVLSRFHHHQQIDQTDIRPYWKFFL